MQTDHLGPQGLADLQAEQEYAEAEAAQMLAEAEEGEPIEMASDDNLACRHCGWLGTPQGLVGDDSLSDVDLDIIRDGLSEYYCPDCEELGTLATLATLREEYEQLPGPHSPEYLLEQIDEDAECVCIFCAWNGSYDEVPPHTEGQTGDECPECGEIGGIAFVDDLRAKYAQKAAENADAPYQDDPGLPDHDAYIIRKGCGCVFAAVIDTPQIERKNMADIMKFFIRSDMIVDRAPASEARRLLVGCTCAMQTKLPM